MSMLYTWNNTYQYDKDFRMHMAQNLNRSWSIILQQAWSLCLTDHIPKQEGNGQQRFVKASGFSPGNSGRDRREKVNEPCHRFNRGKCNFGASCRYEHRCSYCFKYGHQNVNCRKAIADQGNQGTSEGQRTANRKEQFASPSPVKHQKQ